MSKSKETRPSFSEFLYSSREQSGDDSPYQLYYDNVLDAIDEDNIPNANADDMSSWVATYRLIKVEKLKVVKSTKVVKV